MSRESSYYPRRAGVWSPFLNRVDALGESFTRLASVIPEGVSLTGLIGSVLVPGLAYHFRSPDRSGKATIAVCGCLFLTFIAFLGYPVANLAFTLLLCLHVVGVVAYCKPLFMHSGLPARMFVSLALCAMTIAFVYLPLQEILSERLFIPLRLHGHVVVIHCQRTPGRIQRGQWIAFNISAAQNYFNDRTAHGAVFIQAGVNLAPALAIPGDKVTFDNMFYYVNGVPHERFSTMPTSGEWTVPDDCYFAWPEFRMQGHGAVPPLNISDPLMKIAEVTPERFVGTVFKHWFGRRQTFS